jgi:hypothetical protein
MHNGISRLHAANGAANRNGRLAASMPQGE